MDAADLGEDDEGNAIVKMAEGTGWPPLRELTEHFSAPTWWEIKVGFFFRSEEDMLLKVLQYKDLFS